MLATAIVLTLLSLAGWIGFRHSAFSVPFVVFLSMWVQDFFPLSHFPMYSDPDESENFFYLASIDEAGNTTPAPVRQLTSITAPKVKKMFKSWADDDAKAIGKSRKELTTDERAATGQRLLAFLKDQAEKRGETFPAPAALIEVWIVYDNETGLSETPETVATLP